MSMERLTKREQKDDLVICNVKKNEDCNDFCMYGRCKWQKEANKKLKAYEDAEEQGLLIRLPCKVGDTVYSIECNEIKEFTVSNFDVCMKKIYAYQGHIFIGEIGFSVFATKEEAEAALAEMEK